MMSAKGSDPEGDSTGRTVYKVPVDLAVIVLLTVAAWVTSLLPVFQQSLFRILIGGIFVLFAPGYVVVAALYPEKHGDIERDGSEYILPNNINLIERFTLSLAMSIAIVPLLGLFLNSLPVPFDLESVLLLLSGFVLLVSVVAARRRFATDEMRRFQVPYQQWTAPLRDLVVSGTLLDRLAIVIVVISLVIAMAGITNVAEPVDNTEVYTEFYILSSGNERDGQATNYTTDLVSGQESSLIVGIRNHEQRTRNYTVVVRLQEMRVQGNSTDPIASEELTRFRTRLAHGETEKRNVEFIPSDIGERLRLQFLLYRGDPPDQLSADTAYRETHLWVTVS